jgi:hypothetical protein
MSRNQYNPRGKRPLQLKLYYIDESIWKGTNRKISLVQGLEVSILLNCSHYIQNNLQIQCNPCQNSNGILHWLRESNPKICIA